MATAITSLRFLVCAAALGFTLVSSSFAAKNANCPNEGLLLAVVDIYGEANDEIAIDKAAALAIDASSLPPPSVAALSDSTILAIARLLHHRSNGVKVFAANTLGSLGARAKSALPALRMARDQYSEEAVPSQEIAFGSDDGKFEIELAIKEIEMQKGVRAQQIPGRRQSQ